MMRTSWWAREEEHVVICYAQNYNQQTVPLMHGMCSQTKMYTMQSCNAQNEHNYLRITILSVAVLAALMELAIIGNETELVGLLTTVGNIYMYIINHLGKTSSNHRYLTYEVQISMKYL